MTFPLLKFSEVLEDVSRGNVRIPQSEFLKQGALPIVDQGASPVAGYTNDASAAVKHPAPLIVFGDHTRAIKYVDHPFAVGAEGVKLLSVHKDFDPRFVFHYLRSRPLPSAGYSRHFKFLKEIDIPRPGLEEQRRIAAILDQADAVRAKRRQILTHLDAVLPELFDSWAEQCTVESPLAEVATFVRGVTFKPSDKVESSPETVAVMRTKNVQRHLDRSDEIHIDRSLVRRDDRFLRVGDTLVSSANSWNLVGKCCFVDHLDTPAAIGGFVTALRPVAIPPRWLYTWFASRRVQSTARGFSSQTTNIANLNLSRCLQLPVPRPTEEMARDFDDIASRVAHHRGLTLGALAKDDELFASLQSRAFRGEL